MNWLGRDGAPKPMAAGLENPVLRMKLEELKARLERGPINDAGAIEENVWLRSELKALVEILLYLGT